MCYVQGRSNESETVVHVAVVLDVLIKYLVEFETTLHISRLLEINLRLTLIRKILDLLIWQPEVQCVKADTYVKNRG